MSIDNRQLLLVYLKGNIDFYKGQCYLYRDLCLRTTNLYNQIAANTTPNSNSTGKESLQNEQVQESQQSRSQQNHQTPRQHQHQHQQHQQQQQQQQQHHHHHHQSTGPLISFSDTASQFELNLAMPSISPNSGDFSDLIGGLSSNAEMSTDHLSVGLSVASNLDKNSTGSDNTARTNDNISANNNGTSDNNDNHGNNNNNNNNNNKSNNKSNNSNDEDDDDDLNDSINDNASGKLSRENGDAPGLITANLSNGQQQGQQDQQQDQQQDNIQDGASSLPTVSHLTPLSRSSKRLRPYSLHRPSNPQYNSTRTMRTLARASKNGNGNSSSNNNGNGNGNVTTNTHSSPAAVSVHSEAIPRYDFSRHVKEVKVLMEEYLTGLGGQKPIQYLEATYGSKWRGGSHHPIAKQYLRRKNIYDAIERGLQKNYTAWKICEILETQRTFYDAETQKTIKRSMTWLHHNIPEELQ